MLESYVQQLELMVYLSLPVVTARVRCLVNNTTNDYEQFKDTTNNAWNIDIHYCSTILSQSDLATAVVTKASSVARSLKLSNIDPG